MKGNIFARSSTSLALWFYGIFLMSQTRCCISAKQLERELGVSYKTAFRMFQKIRYHLMEEEPTLLGGSEGKPIELDETYVGGVRRGTRAGRPRAGDPVKTPVFAMIERKGRLIARVVPDATTNTLLPLVREFVLPRTAATRTSGGRTGTCPTMATQHGTVPHGRRIYVIGAAHTNTAENFFSLVKGSLRGVYKGVSKKHLQSYLNEFTWLQPP